MRTKNRPLFLARALDDVAGQRFEDWHLFVVNDGGDSAPVDDAVAAQAGLADRCTVIHLEQATGRAAAGNRGLQAGTAQFVAFHDDDDTWDPRFLERTVDQLAQGEDVGLSVRTEMVHEQQIGKRIVETTRESFHPHMQEPTYFDQLRFNHVAPIAMLVRREFLEEIGGLDESVPMVDDWVLNLALTKSGRYGFLDGEPLAFWHLRTESRGDAGNASEIHRTDRIRDERRYRDRQLREYVERYGAGSLLYLAKFIDERASDIHARLDLIEQQQEQILAMLRETESAAPYTQRMRGLATRLRG